MSALTSAWPQLVIAACVGLIGVAVVFFRDSTRWKRRLRRVPSTLIADAPDGLVKLVGKARVLRHRLTAPVSGRSCIGYQVETFKGDESTSAETCCADFLVEDGSGEALIWVQKQQLMFEVDEAVKSGLPIKILGFGGETTKHEGVLEEGEVIVVYGIGKREADRYVVTGTPKVPLLISDDPELVRAARRLA